MSHHDSTDVKAPPDTRRLKLLSLMITLTISFPREPSLGLTTSQSAPRPFTDRLRMPLTSEAAQQSGRVAPPGTQTAGNAQTLFSLSLMLGSQFGWEASVAFGKCSEPLWLASCFQCTSFSDCRDLPSECTVYGQCSRSVLTCTLSVIPWEKKMLEEAASTHSQCGF